MNTTTTHPLLAPRHVRAAAPHASIEWEEMPSFARRMVPMDLNKPASAPAPIVRPSKASDFNTAWGVTMPASLDTQRSSTPFREAIQGLATREVDEPELFKHFFG